MEIQFVNYIFGQVIKYSAVLLLITTLVLSTYTKLFRKRKIKVPIKAYLHTDIYFNTLELKQTFLSMSLYQFHKGLIITLGLSFLVMIILFLFNNLL